MLDRHHVNLWDNLVCILSSSRRRSSKTFMKQESLYWERMKKKLTPIASKEAHITFWLGVSFIVWFLSSTRDPHTPLELLLCSALSEFLFCLQENTIWLGQLWQNATIEVIFANIFWLCVHPCSVSHICHLQTCFCVQRKRGNLIAGGVWLILLSLFRATWWRNTLKLTVVPKCSLQTERCRSCRKEDWIRYTCVIHYELLELLTSLMKISLIKISWCCYFHFISADYILGGNAD